jgi:predicted TIM-barrel fold metal-dependent hydrolase
MEKNMNRREFVRSALVAAGSAAAVLSLSELSWAEKIFNQELMNKRTYSGFQGLTDLPYFEMTDRGLLRLTVDGLDGGIDGHTHFAMNMLAGLKPDLQRSTPKTEYYIEPDDKLSLNVYMNKNQTPADKQKMTRTTLLQMTPLGSSVTDTHTIPNLLAEMDLLRIEKAVVFPIKTGMPFGDEMTQWYLSEIEKSGKKDRFIVCCSVKPTSNNAAKEVGEYKAMGLKGVKMHPNFARFYPNDRAAWPCYEAAGKNNLPVLIHCGRTGQEPKKGIANMLYSEDYADIKNFSEPVESFPRVRFVFCHAGALQNEEAIRIAKKNKNVWMDVQGQSVDNIRKMIRQLGPERLMFGSDFPFYPVATVLARMLVATEKDKVVRKMIFSENARRFWNIAK